MAHMYSIFNFYSLSTNQFSKETKIFSKAAPLEPQSSGYPQFLPLREVHPPPIWSSPLYHLAY